MSAPATIDAAKATPTSDSNTNPNFSFVNKEDEEHDQATLEDAKPGLGLPLGDVPAGAVAGGKDVSGSLDSFSDEFDLYRREDIDPVYHAKAHLLNEAFAEIGMGRYQV